MTFSVTGTLAQETIGLRMEYVSLDPGIRNDALTRLNSGRDPMAVAYTLSGISQRTGQPVMIDLFRDDILGFAGKLDEIAAGRGLEYLQAESLLPAGRRDTWPVREHVRDFWEKALTANPALADQIRQAFVNALNVGEVKVRWGQPGVTGKAPGSAEYNGGQVVMTINPPTP